MTNKLKIKSDGGGTSYYELPQSAKNLQDLIEHKGMNYAVANIFKGAYRLGEKEGTDRRYDLNKIIWFAERELALLDTRSLDLSVRTQVITLSGGPCDGAFGNLAHPDQKSFRVKGFPQGCYQLTGKGLWVWEEYSEEKES